MKVKELIKKLVDCNPEATVFETYFPRSDGGSLEEVEFVVEDKSGNFIKIGCHG